MNRDTGYTVTGVVRLTDGRVLVTVRQPGGRRSTVCVAAARARVDDIDRIVSHVLATLPPLPDRTF